VQKTLAGAEQARATADEKRTNAGATVFGAHLDAAQFTQDALREAQGIYEANNRPSQPQSMGQPPGGFGRPPIPGARLAPDGRHYVPDPRRPGKYLLVA
jgi:hypothetical protein